jgi:hypothetical protein
MPNFYYEKRNEKCNLMNVTKIEKFAQAEIKKGCSHQCIFNTIVGDSNFNIHDVANIVRRVPTIAKKEKYKGLHWFIIIVLAFSIILNLLPFIIGLASHNKFSLLYHFPSFNILLIIGIAMYKRHAYLITGFFLILECLLAIGQIVSSSNFLYLAHLIVLIFTIYLCFYLNVKMVSDYELNRALLLKDPNTRVNSLIFKE